MIRVRQLKVEVSKKSDSEILNELARKLRIPVTSIKSYEIYKESLDARNKEAIYFVYELNVEVEDEELVLKKNKSNDVFLTKEEEYQIPKGTNLDKKIIIVGSGPAGLFASYILTESGYHPIIIERGKKIEDRTKDVDKFFETGVLEEESNIQFGEGGAGTFSDGKLNTLVKDTNNRGRKVFKTFIKHGAPSEILYSYKPHIGTNLLREVIKNMRESLLKMGVTIRYETCLTDINIKDKKLVSITVNNNEEIPCDNLVLAIGHSARDTFRMLYDKNLEMEAKPFAVGLRVQHPQRMIDKSQYGTKYEKYLHTASYKLTYKASNNRGVYSFCMCPGGYVINASSRKGYLAINGMSNHERDTKNANSAIVVTVFPKDFGNNPLDGILYQEKLEKKAYEAAAGKIPVQLLKDFMTDEKSTSFEEVEPIFKGDYDFASLNEILSPEIVYSLKEAFPNFGKKIKGFDRPDTILAGVESRTSSPVRINRSDNLESNIKGIYPCGEGAGYAGGITSAAIDGIKIAEAIIEN